MPILVLLLLCDIRLLPDEGSVGFVGLLLVFEKLLDLYIGHFRVGGLNLFGEIIGFSGRPLLLGVLIYLIFALLLFLFFLAISHHDEVFFLGGLLGRFVDVGKHQIQFLSFTGLRNRHLGLQNELAVEISMALIWIRHVHDIRHGLAIFHQSIGNLFVFLDEEVHL